jgi:accessory gene regulator protein AgrB
MNGPVVAIGLVVVAVICVVLAVLYYMGTISFLTLSGSTHGHHTTHAIAFGILAILCLVAANFARQRTTS